MNLSDEQVRQIARSFLADVGPYVNSNKGKYSRFLREPGRHGETRAAKHSIGGSDAPGKGGSYV